jgi:hypothetical protein
MDREVQAATLKCLTEVRINPSEGRLVRATGDGENQHDELAVDVVAHVREVGRSYR